MFCYWQSIVKLVFSPKGVKIVSNPPAVSKKTEAVLARGQTAAMPFHSDGMTTSFLANGKWTKSICDLVILNAIVEIAWH